MTRLPWRKVLFLPLVNAAALAVVFLVIEAAQCLPRGSKPISAALVLQCTYSKLGTALVYGLTVLAVQAVVHPLIYASGVETRWVRTILVDAFVLGFVAGGLVLNMAFQHNPQDVFYDRGTWNIHWQESGGLFLVAVLTVGVIVFLTEFVLQWTLRRFARRRSSLN